MTLLSRIARRVSITVTAALVSFVPVLAPADDTTDRLEAYLGGLMTLRADFHQVTFNADHSQMLESDGSLYLKRPGRFRWEYRTPFEQVIIADGKRVYVHDIELDQVYHRSQREALRGTPALLLTDDAPLEQLFVVEPMAEGGERDWVVLQPRDPNTEIERIEIGLNGHQLDTLVMVDQFGQVTHIRLTEIERNPTLDAALFRFDDSIGGDFLKFD